MKGTSLTRLLYLPGKLSGLYRDQHRENEFKLLSLDQTRDHALLAEKRLLVYA